MVAVMHCGCKTGQGSEFQDKTYGTGKRVHNRTKQNKPENEREWRCTSCGQTK